MNYRSLHLHQGYTLIEVMVVILVIGFALSLVAVRLSPEDRQREHQIQLFLDFFQQAKERAVFSGSIVSVSCAWSPGQQWRCEQIVGTSGQQVTDAITLPQGWLLMVFPDLGTQSNTDGQFLNIQFFPSGEASRVNIIVRDADSNAWRFQLTETGQFNLEDFQ